jgi:hypothetical protein
MGTKDIDCYSLCLSLSLFFLLDEIENKLELSELILSIVMEVPVERKSLLGCNYSSSLALLIEEDSAALFIRNAVEDIDFGKQLEVAGLPWVMQVKLVLDYVRNTFINQQ